MTQSRKELSIACSYLLRLIKPHVDLSVEQINVFKRTFYDVLSKRFVGHWFPGIYEKEKRDVCNKIDVMFLFQQRLTVEARIDVYKQKIGKIQCLYRSLNVPVCRCIDIYLSHSQCGLVSIYFYCFMRIRQLESH